MAEQYLDDLFDGQEEEEWPIVVQIKEEKEEGNSYSQLPKGEEVMPPPPKKWAGSKGSKGVNPRLPLTTEPTPIPLGRRFMSKTKRKATSGEDSSSSADEDAASQFMCKRRRGINLTLEQEQNLAEWYQDHEIFYNKKLTEYKDTGKKAHLLRKKAAEINVHVNQLRIWYDGMRTRFSKISGTRSGQGPVLDELTERDKWIYSSFQFLHPHIVRVPSRQSKIFGKSRPSTTSAQNAQVVVNERQRIDNPAVDNNTAVASAATSVEPGIPNQPQEQLMKELSQQSQDTMALQNRLMTSVQAQSANIKQVSHFMAFLGSLCETMTTPAWKSFMVKAHQLALDHLTEAAPPPQYPPTYYPPQTTHHHQQQIQHLQQEIQHLQQQQQQIQYLQQQLAAFQPQQPQ